MTNKPSHYDIPVEMRDFAQKSVDQARKAFDGFLSAAQKAVTAVEAPANAIGEKSQEAARKTLSYAENNIAAAFDLAEKLVHAKDINEVAQHQSEYLKNQFAALQEQAHEFGSTLKKTASEATQYMQKTMKEATQAASDKPEATESTDGPSKTSA